MHLHGEIQAILQKHHTVSLRISNLIYYCLIDFWFWFELGRHFMTSTQYDRNLMMVARTIFDSMKGEIIGLVLLSKVETRKSKTLMAL